MGYFKISPPWDSNEGYISECVQCIILLKPSDTSSNCHPNVFLSWSVDVCIWPRWTQVSLQLHSFVLCNSSLSGTNWISLRMKLSRPSKNIFLVGFKMKKSFWYYLVCQKLHQSFRNLTIYKSHRNKQICNESSILFKLTRC